MSARRVRTEEVVLYLGRGRAVLERLRAEGLFESEELEPEEAEELRVASVLMEELGVNPAGVDVALHLRRRLFALEQRACELARVLRERQGGDR